MPQEVYKVCSNKQIGIKFAEETDNAKFRSSLIYHATVEEDRTKLWGQPAGVGWT